MGMGTFANASYNWFKIIEGAIQMKIETISQLRALYPPAIERSLKKQLSYLDEHCQRFISLSPFVVMASSGNAFAMDASPRGGVPGFIKALDQHTLLIPDAKGNNRLDSLENIVQTGKVGLLFLIPGVDETLRVNGTAVLSTASDRIDLFSEEKHRPRLVIEVTVVDAYLHCAKALMRSALWSPSSLVERSVLPTMGEMINSQSGGSVAVETQAEMVARYAADL
jgi:uncharacterized protein